MDETASLRRTLRRCTAALTAALGAAVSALGAESPGLALALVLAGLLYLAGSLVYTPAWALDPGESSGRSP